MDFKIPVITPKHQEIAIASNWPFKFWLIPIIRSARAAHHAKRPITISTLNYLVEKVFANGWTTREPFQAPDKKLVEGSPMLLIGVLGEDCALPRSPCDGATCRTMYGTVCTHKVGADALEERRKGAPVYVRLVPFGRREDGSLIGVFDTVDAKGISIPDVGFGGIHRYTKYADSEKLNEAVAKAHDEWLESRVREFNEALAVFIARCRLVHIGNNLCNRHATASLPRELLEQFVEVYRHGPDHGLEIFE